MLSYAHAPRNLADMARDSKERAPTPSNVHRIGRDEDVPGFIRRDAGDRGRVSTRVIAQRFGWDMRVAKRRLDALAREGRIVDEGLSPQAFPGTGGQVTLWGLPREGDDASDDGPDSPTGRFR